MLDGITVTQDGDLFITYYFVHPTMAHMKLLDELIERNMFARDGSILVAQVIVADQPIPNRETQVESARLVEKIASKTREILTYPLGDTFRSITVRSVLRLLNMLSRKRQIVVDSWDELHSEIQRNASADTPDRVRVEAMLSEARTTFERWNRERSKSP